MKLIYDLGQNYFRNTTWSFVFKWEDELEQWVKLVNKNGVDVMGINQKKECKNVHNFSGISLWFNLAMLNW